MRVDAVVLIEQPHVVARFYPNSLTTPLSLLVCGGLRLVEQVFLRFRLALGYDVEILQVTRPHLVTDWRRILPDFLIEQLLDVKITVHYTSPDKLEKYLTKYDRVITLPANALPQIDEVKKIVEEASIQTRGASLREVLRALDKVAVRTVSSIYEAVGKNIELLDETLQLLGIGDRLLIVDTEIETQTTKIEKPCLLYRCEVKPYTLLRAGCTIYPGVVVGGELKNTIVDAYSHKEHHGYLGDSYIGRHVNMGAGTTTSNLKNTRGTIKYLGIDTRLKKLGAFIGDFVKTAIGTYIYCGKTVGSYSHIYHVVDQDVLPCTIFRKGYTQVMQLDKLLQFIERDCAKHSVDVEAEKRIAKCVYDYVVQLSEEASLGYFTLKLK